MNGFKKWLIPVALVCLLLATLVGCSSTPASLGEIFDPSGNPFANRFSDVKDIRTATFVVAASDSEHKYEADYFCSGTNDHVQIQAGLDALPATGGCIFLLDGTYTLGAQVARAIDDVKFMGCGQATLLNLDGGTAVITAGVQDGWTLSHLGTDAGGVDISTATESAIRSVWIAGVRTDDPAAVSITPITLVVAANDSLDPTRADYQCNGTNDNVEIQAAIDALPATGGEVALLDGTYNIEVALVLDSYQALRGCGRDTILTTATANCDITTAIGGSGTEKIGILIADLCIDGADINDDAILWTYVDYSIITNVWLLDNNETGILLTTSDHNIITENIITGNNYYGISLSGSDYNHIEGNTINDTDWLDNIYLDGSEHNTIIGNVLEGAEDYSLYLYGSDYNTIAGNICESSRAMGGIFLETSEYNNVTSNYCIANNGSGIVVSTSADFNNISENMCALNGLHGIAILGSNENKVTDNLCLENSQDADNTSDDILLDTNSDYNTVDNNTCRAGDQANKPKYGININNANCSNNRVIGNDLYDDGFGTAPFHDVGTATKLPSITVPFSDGDDPQDSGYLIDADTEFARAFIFLNLEVVQVVRIKVYARAVPAEADKMRAEFVVYGGKDDEAYTAHNGSVANHPSTSSSFQADDVIYWTITEAGVLALVGGDSVEVKVLHEAVGDGDIDTQAYLRTVTIEYV